MGREAVVFNDVLQQESRRLFMRLGCFRIEGISGVTASLPALYYMCRKSVRVMYVIVNAFLMIYHYQGVRVVVESIKKW